ncbi:MAG: hypothetical protein ACI4EA_07200 [Candidatus Ornithomonoglobus sp.]
MSRKSLQTYTSADLKALFTILVHRVYPAYNISAWKSDGSFARVNISVGTKKYRAVPVNFTSTGDGFMFEIFLSADNKKELRLTDTEFYRLICDIRNDRPDEINSYMARFANTKDELFY